MIALIKRRQYSGAKNECPLNHLKEFEKYCNTIKVNGVSQEFIWLKLFPFSLISRALEWLDKEVKPNSLRTWDKVTKKFLSWFYPQKKTAEARALIQGFKQRPNESLYEEWERYKEYQRECPHHGIPNYQVIQIFYGGLSPQGKSCHDWGTRGPIMNITEEEVVDIIEYVVKYYRDWQDGERDSTSKSGSSVYSIYHLNAINNLSSQMTNLGKEMTAIKAKLESSSSFQASNLPSQFKGRGTLSNCQPLPSSNNMPSGCLFCDACGSYDHDSCNCPHASPECGDDFDNNESEHVNYVSNNNVQRTNLEDIIKNQTKLLNTYMAISDKKFNEMMTHNKMLENQISQLANALKDQENPTFLPSQGLNPKKPVNAIVTRNGKVLEERLPRKRKTRRSPRMLWLRMREIEHL
ncbi:uncharacterized protein LOC110681611 [Chenopodium quinoa]|uniref:uncharacterized protein LOC110681611 n=1 Tax=Chenopodium quinoa TaxID=63459 RepID=UPI000B796F09|nr:uncharacterized protein LOC110681611 [Chenopodium quinoa]